jgi:hypothetical protein
MRMSLTLPVRSGRRIARVLTCQDQSNDLAESHRTAGWRTKRGMGWFRYQMVVSGW